MGMQYIYICGTTLPFTALQVNPTMTTSAAEKPENVKKVHLIKYFNISYLCLQISLNPWIWEDSQSMAHIFSSELYNPPDMPESYICFFTEP